MLKIEILSDSESVETVEKRVKVLTDEEIKKLMIFASFWVKKRQLYRNSIKPGELLNEAIYRTLIGRRKWKKKNNNFIKHLDGAMQSISGHWVKEFTEKSGRPVDDEKYSNDKSDFRDSEISQELENFIETIFKDDLQSLEILRCISYGMTKVEIKGNLNLSELEYEAAMKRIRRKGMKFKKRSQI